MNQIAFVYALERSTASVLGLILGATPIFAALFGIAAGLESPPSRFWLGALVSFAGVALVALGSGGEVSGDLGGVLFGVLTAATWAAYSILVTPLMRRHSATTDQRRRARARLDPDHADRPPAASDARTGTSAGTVWLLFAFAVLGPLVVTNELWFRALDRIGPARATLAANLQPFLAAAIAVVLLSETLSAVELAGGLLIAVGILAARRRRGLAAATAVAFGRVSPQRRTALVSVVAAAVLIAVKLVVGVAAGSLGLLADAAHSGTDLVAALLTFFAVGVATKPADEAHLYGHGKAEHLAALAEAAFLVLVSLLVGGARRRAARRVDLARRRAGLVGVRRARSRRRDRPLPHARLASRGTTVRERGARLERRCISAQTSSPRSRCSAASSPLAPASPRATRSQRSSSPSSSSLAASRLIRRNVDVLMDRAPADAARGGARGDRRASSRPSCFAGFGSGRPRAARSPTS